MFPTGGVLWLGAPPVVLADVILEHPFVEANDESVRGSLLLQRLVEKPGQTHCVRIFVQCDQRVLLGRAHPAINLWGLPVVLRMC